MTPPPVGRRMKIPSTLQVICAARPDEEEETEGRCRKDGSSSNAAKVDSHWQHSVQKCSLGFFYFYTFRLFRVVNVLMALSFQDTWFSKHNLICRFVLNSGFAHFWVQEQVTWSQWFDSRLPKCNAFAGPGACLEGDKNLRIVIRTYEKSQTWELCAYVGTSILESGKKNKKGRKINICFSTKCHYKLGCSLILIIMKKKIRTVQSDLWLYQTSLL